jgi:hypothetical protein
MRLFILCLMATGFGAGTAAAQAPSQPTPGAQTPSLEAPSLQARVAQADAASEQDVATVKALQAMHACIDGQVKAADDHVSPPETIAEKIKDACRAEQDQFFAAYKAFAADHPRLEPPPDQITEADRLAAAKAAVVEARKEGR